MRIFKWIISSIGLFTCVSSHAGPFLNAAATGNITAMGKLISDKTKQIEFKLEKAGKLTSGAMSPETLARLSFYMEKNEVGQNALQVAALNRKFDSVQYLVSHRFPLNGSDRFGSSVLHSAVRGGSVSIVDFLHKQGLSYLDQDQDGNNALHLAANYGKLEIAESILKEHHDPRIFVQNKRGETPLVAAAKSKHEEISLSLIEAGAPIHTKTRQGRTPLHFAAEGGMKALAEALFARGVSIEDRDLNGHTPVELAKPFPEIESHFIGRRDESIRTAIKDAKHLPELHTIQSELSGRGQLAFYRGELHARIWELLETQLAVSRTVAEVHSLNKKLQNQFPEIEPHSYANRIHTRITQIVSASADPSVNNQTASELSDNLVLTEGNFPGVVTDELRHQILEKMRPLLFHEIQAISSFEKLQEHLNNRTNRHPGLLNEAMTQEYQAKALPFIELRVDGANSFESAKTAFQSSYAFWRPNQVPEVLKQKARESYVRVLPTAIRNSQTLEQLHRIQNDLVGLIHANSPEYGIIKAEILAKTLEIAPTELDRTSEVGPLAKFRMKILDIYAAGNQQTTVPQDLLDAIAHRAKTFIPSELARVRTVDQLVELRRNFHVLFQDDSQVLQALKERELEWIGTQIENSNRLSSIVRLIDQIELHFPEHLGEALNERIRSNLQPLALAELENLKSESELFELKAALNKYSGKYPMSPEVEEQLERKIQSITHHRLQEIVKESGVVLRPPMRKAAVKPFPDAICVSCFEPESKEMHIHRGPADCDCFGYCQNDATDLLKSTLQHAEEEVGFCPSC